jgi:hypothetical protein
MTDQLLFITGVVVFSLMALALVLTAKEFSDLKKKSKGDG